MNATTPQPIAVADPTPLLRPGETCWRVEHAPRVAFLMDNQAYFAAAKETMLAARQSIMLVGWMFDPRTRLEPGVQRGSQPDEIGALLDMIAATRPEVDVRVLIWDAAYPMAVLRGLFPQRAKLWFNEHVRFCLDDAVPRGACHHEKILVVDDAVAFCSGTDLFSNRWDAPEHLDQDPRRRLPSGRIHVPRHATTMLVDGAAARALGELCRERWRRIGEVVGAPASDETADIWPKTVPAVMIDAQVGVARTIAAWSGEPEVNENEALFLATIAAARTSLYLENQYLASPVIGDALAARLAEAGGPEIVIVIPPHSPSFAARFVMDAARNALLKQLHDADRFGRLAVYAPHAPNGRAIIVHSKLTIMDDRLIRIGSSNLDNRSLGFDTECDLAIEPDAAGRNAIRTMRTRLVAHFLDRPEEDVEEALHTHGGLIATIEALDDPANRRLRPFGAHGAGPVDRITAWRHLGDPIGPADSWRPWRRPAGPSGPPWLALGLLSAGVAFTAVRLMRRTRARRG